MAETEDYPSGVVALLVLLEASPIASIRSVVTGIINIINEPDATARDLREAIEIDPPLAGRVLKLANSAYYAPRVKILDIMQAIIFVGFDAVKELALSQKVAGIISREDDRALGLWRHSVAVALAAKMIYRREFRLRGDDAYAAGLLHDIGTIVLEQFDPAACRAVEGVLETEGRSLVEVEAKILGFDHAFLGQAVTRSWDFPEDLVTAIGNHHRPDRATEEEARLAETLFVADHYARSQGYGSEVAGVGAGQFRDTLRRLDLTRQGLALLFNDVKTEIRRMEARGLLSHE